MQTEIQQLYQALSELEDTVFEKSYKFDHFKSIAYLMTGKLDFSKVNKFY